MKIYNRDKYKVPVGEKVAIISAGGIGFDIAKHLSETADYSEPHCQDHRMTTSIKSAEGCKK